MKLFLPFFRQFRQIDECKLLAKNYRVSSGRQGRPKSSRRVMAKKGVKVFDTKFGPMNINEVTHLYNNRRYATSSQKAGKEFVLLPMHRVRLLVFFIPFPSFLPSFLHYIKTLYRLCAHSVNGLWSSTPIL